MIKVLISAFTVIWFWSIVQGFSYSLAPLVQINSERLSSFMFRDLDWSSAEGSELVGYSQKNSQIQAYSMDASNREALSNQWVTLNPLDPKAWLYLVQSQTTQSEVQSAQALNQAMQLAQNRTQILNDIYLEYLFKGDTESALNTATLIVGNRHELFDSYFFDLYSLVNSETLFDQFLMKIGHTENFKPEDAQSDQYYVWDKALSMAIAYDDEGLVKRILEVLPVDHTPQETIIADYLSKISKDQSWLKIQPIWTEYADYKPELNKVSDPRFESFPDSIGACWSSKPHEHVEVNTEGGSGLRVEFDGLSNTSFYHVKCLVALEPNSNYSLSWRWYGENITTRSGIFVEVSKPTKSKTMKLIASGDRYGSWPWQSEAMQFETDNETQLIEVTLRRKPTTNLDNKISGVVLINDIELIKN